MEWLADGVELPEASAELEMSWANTGMELLSATPKAHAIAKPRMNECRPC
jgi:hypothetical protein